MDCALTCAASPCGAAAVCARVGGGVYVHLGGYLRAFDCSFTMPPWSEVLIRREQEYMLGGDVCIEGGRADFIACNMYVIVVGFINDFSREVGGSVLLLGGVATFTGVNFMTTQVFHCVMGFGMHVTIWGGVGIFTGWYHTHTAPRAVACPVNCVCPSRLVVVRCGCCACLACWLPSCPMQAARTQPTWSSPSWAGAVATSSSGPASASSPASSSPVRACSGSHPHPHTGVG